MLKLTNIEAFCIVMTTEVFQLPSLPSLSVVHSSFSTLAGKRCPISFAADLPALQRGTYHETYSSSQTGGEYRYTLLALTATIVTELISNTESAKKHLGCHHSQMLYSRLSSTTCRNQRRAIYQAGGMYTPQFYGEVLSWHQIQNRMN